MEMPNVTAPECNTQLDVNSESTHQPTTRVPPARLPTQVSGDNTCFWAGSRGSDTSQLNLQLNDTHTQDQCKVGGDGHQETSLGNAETTGTAVTSPSSHTTAPTPCPGEPLPAPSCSSTPRTPVSLRVPLA